MRKVEIETLRWVAMLIGELTACRHVFHFETGRSDPVCRNCGKHYSETLPPMPPIFAAKLAITEHSDVR